MAAPLLGTAIFFEEGADDGWAGIAVVAVWTFLSWCVMVPAATFLRDLERGTWVVFFAGVVAVLLAISLTFGGGFLVAPALATVPLAASITRSGRFALVRAVISVALLVLSSWLYVWIVVEY